MPLPRRPVPRNASRDIPIFYSATFTRITTKPALRASGKRFPTQTSYNHPPATAPMHGATTGTHHQPFPLRNTSPPQPAIAVNSRGAKSRAGLMA